MVADYFPNNGSKVIFKLIKTHYDKHKTIPSKDSILVLMDRLNGVSSVDFESAKTLLDELNTIPEDLGWLLTESERYIQERAMHNALSEAIRIQENFELPVGERNKKIPDIGAIPDIMKKALSVGFSFSIGHDYWDDVESRWQSYVTKSKKIPFNIKILNLITKGGVERKTLNLILAGTNVGKSLGLCSLAADYIMQGYNVLYVSMEMGEEVCAKRIDANILDVSLDDLDDGLITKTDFMNRFKVAKGKTNGKLVVRQFPTGGATVNHLNILMQDLQMKRNFKPDIVIVDYLGIMASSRMGFSENSYTMVKAIAEEVRGFAIEHDVVVWSAAQTNRNGWDNTDVQLSDIGESAGIAHTVDFMFTVMEDEDMAQQGLQLFKQLKSRYADKSKWNKFTMAVSKANQRWTDVVHDDPELNEAVKKSEMRQTDSQKRREKMKDIMESTDDDASWD